MIYIEGDCSTKYGKGKIIEGDCLMTITYDCAYAIKTRSGIEYGTTSVDAITETSAVVKINKKILDEKDDSYNRIVNIIVNEDYLATTEHYDEHEIKDIISKAKSKKKKSKGKKKGR